MGAFLGTVVLELNVKRGQAPAAPVLALRLDPHGHYDVFKVGVIRNRDQRRRVRVAQGDVDLVAFQVVQDVEQVGDVETDVDGFSAVVDFQFLDGFFLVGVGLADFHAAGGDDAAHALEFVARHDGGALQGAQKLIPADREVVFISLGDHPRVIREFAFNQLGNQLNIRKSQFHLAGGDVELDGVVVFS